MHVMARVLIVFVVSVVGASAEITCFCNETHGNPRPTCIFNNFKCTAEQNCFLQQSYCEEIRGLKIRWGCSPEIDRALCKETPNEQSIWQYCNTSDICNLELLKPLLSTATVSTATVSTATMSMETVSTYVSSSPSPFPPTTVIEPGGSNSPQSTRDIDQTLYIGLTVGVPLVCVVLVTVLVLVLTIIYLRRRKKRRKALRRPSSPGDKVRSPVGGYELDDSDGSGSGSGLPLLVQRTVARSIQIGDPIGSGRYGQVYIGRYQGENVAVKKFMSKDDKSWFRETEIYNTVLLWHVNILRFFASDMTSNNGVTELWLITEYHGNGSLYDYLNQKIISQETMLKMAMSICSGLSHMHTELFGTQAKPAVAHRDMKSKNILVKSNLTCCIADFGLAVVKEGINKVNVPANPKQGTKRYMAPEILSETINMLDFESYKQADIYAAGLVLWELCKMCRSTAPGADKELCYEQPFQGLVPTDPSFEDMRRLVVVERRQPTIPDWWHQDELLREMTKMMRECWYFNSTARPTAVYLKKKLLRLYEEEKMSYSDHE